MPAPKLSKSSLSNAVAALKDQGFTPSSVNLKADGSFTIDIAVSATSQDVPQTDKSGPKKWDE
jgi:hypothetical protein